MAEASTQGYDSKTGNTYQNEYKGKDSGKTASNVQAGGADKLKPKTTGRGMLPGESVSDWKARLKKMDEDNSVQQQALTK